MDRLAGDFVGAVKQDDVGVGAVRQPVPIERLPEIDVHRLREAGEERARPQTQAEGHKDRNPKSEGNSPLHSTMRM